VVSSDYRHLELENKPQILSAMQISDAAYKSYTEGMRLVVTEGTAAKIFGKKYPVEVAAKTGTAQHGGGRNTSDHGAFVCYAPYSDPEIAVVVYGEQAGHGSTMGQIAKAILDVYFDVDEIGDVVTNENQVS
jgi:penicillin-binding protein 2